MYTDLTLRHKLERTLQEVEASIEVLNRTANEMGIAATEMRDANGGWPVIPLLNAKAQCLAGLVVLKTK